MPTKEPDFTVDWSDLKQVSLAFLAGNPPKMRVGNANIFNESLVHPSSWHGYTAGQVERWLREGFATSAIQGLADTLPATEKRRRVYKDEGDELHIDRAYAGEENFM